MKKIKQLSVILLVSLLAEFMEYVIPLPVAASVYGLLLMLFGLMTHIIPLEKVEGAADFLIENMALMFVPPTVAIISCVEELKQMLVPIIVICLVTTLIVMVVTGRTAQFLIRHKVSKGEKK